MGKLWWFFSPYLQVFFPTPFIYNWFFGPVVFSLSLGHPAGPTASFDSLVSEFHHVSSKGFSSSKKEPPCFFLTKVATTSKGQMRVVLLPLLHFPLGDHHTRGDFPSPPRCRKKLGKWLNSACLDTYIHWFQRLLDPATQKLTQSMAKL